MANSLGIDFNPQPAYGSDPFTPIVEGVQMGLGLNRDIQNQKMQQQKFTQDQEQEVEKMKLLKFGQLVDIYDKTKSPKLKEIYYREAIKPAAKQILGADLPDDPGSFGDYFSAAAELSNQYSAGKMKFPDYKKRLGSIYFDALKAGDLEAASAIATGTRFGEEEASSGMNKDREARIFAMRSKVESSQPYKNYVETRNRTDALESAVADPGAFGDLGILYDYMRSLDPDSVVREGEQLLFRRTGSLSQKAANALNTLATGKTLTEDQRNEVLKYSRRRRDIAERSYLAHVEPTLKQAERLGFQKDEIDPFFLEREAFTQMGTVTFVDSDGIQHTIPKTNLDAAKKRDPGLRLVK